MQLLHRRALLSAVAASMVVALSPAHAAEERWSPLRDAADSTLAVALDGRTTALVSVGGADDATVYDQRRTDTGAVGPRTEVVTVEDAENCRPVEAVTALGNVAVAVECQTKTGLEDPPTTFAALVWTGDDGWVSHVQPEGRLGSLDYSPGGQHVAFATNSRYGRPHHVISYHADLGWRDLTVRERGIGEDMVAAVNDAGNVVALRGGGTEDEPGYWFGGRLRIDSYDAAAGTWTERFVRRYPDGGIRPTALDLVKGRIMAAVVRSRSTGQLDGFDAKVLLLSGRPDEPRQWTTSSWKRRVVTASAALTRDGVGVAAWQVVGDERRTAKPWFATWTPRHQPAVHDLRWRTTLTDAAEAGRTLDLSVSADGNAAIGYVRHRRGVAHSLVAAATFRVGRNGGLGQQVDTAWRQPVNTTVEVVSSAGAASITLGRLIGPFFPSPRVRYSVRP